MRPRGERGSVTLELAALTPAVLMLLGLVVAAGRIQVAGGAVEQAARAAARQASQSRTASTARAAAEQVARDTLAAQDLACTGLRVDVDTAGFAVPVGRPAQVRVTVACTLRLSDLAVPGLGSRTVTAAAVSPLDRYRTR
jgi:Flp pilus assembly protein TadG